MTYTHLVAVLTLVSATTAKVYADTPRQNPTAAHIQRTWKTLSESTAEKPAAVRILFYGQSITAQAWTQTVIQQLKAQYPTVQFDSANLAIGGYSSESLIRTADHDLYPWYPDLLFFHVYGPIDKYEDIIRQVREKTSAEVVLWSSHLSNKPDEKNPNDERGEKIEAIAKKYNCMFINLREKWRKHLVTNNINYTNLLSDSIHLRPEGCALYAQLISEELGRNPALGDNPTQSGTITFVPFSAAKKTATGYELAFEGNHVVAVSDGTGNTNVAATILLDQKPPADDVSMWAVSRPSNNPKNWMPAINNIAFTKPLVEENWTLTCLADSATNASPVHFKVDGSVTGFAGEGWNTNRFVSPTGRVIIEPSDWRLPWALSYVKMALPNDFQVTWKTYPLFAARYTPQAHGKTTRLLQGCANGRHVLTLVCAQPTEPLGIQGFWIYKPAK